MAEGLLEVPVGLARTALDLELAESAIIADSVSETPCVFLAGLHRMEGAIAERLLQLVKGTLPWSPIDPAKALPWVEQRTGLELSDSQRTAIRLVLVSKVLGITGGPGVGKTTIVNAILRILSAKGVELPLYAPTGRAAKRMMDASGFAAKTAGGRLYGDLRWPGPRVRCTAAICESVRPLGIAVRSGLHTGEIELKRDDVARIGVHMPARVAAEAEAGKRWC